MNVPQGGESSPPDCEKISPEDLNYAKDLWTLGNVVAGFAIYQGILFLTNIGPKKSDLYCEIQRTTFNVVFAGFAIALGTVLYLAVVLGAHRAQYKLLDRSKTVGAMLLKRFRYLMIGETALIVILGSVSFLGAVIPQTSEIRLNCYLRGPALFPVAPSNPSH